MSIHNPEYYFESFFVSFHVNIKSETKIDRKGPEIFFEKAIEP